MTLSKSTPLSMDLQSPESNKGKVFQTLHLHM